MWGLFCGGKQGIAGKYPLFFAAIGLIHLVYRKNELMDKLGLARRLCMYRWKVLRIWS
jgi:hypothetical protein